MHRPPMHGRIMSIRMSSDTTSNVTYRQEGSACQHCCASSCSGDGQLSSKAGRSQPSQTPTQICASIRQSYTGVALHISHTAPNASRSVSMRRGTAGSGRPTTLLLIA